MTVLLDWVYWENFIKCSDLGFSIGWRFVSKEWVDLRGSRETATEVDGLMGLFIIIGEVSG